MSERNKSIHYCLLFCANMAHCSFLFFVSFLPCLAMLLPPAAAAGGGRWQLLQRSIGVSAMHMQLLRNDRVIVFDRTDFGPSNLSLGGGRCRHDPRDWTLKDDCTAHAAEYDVAANSVRPLMILTDPWCSSGALAPDGRLVQTGGNNDGERGVRYLAACGDRDCDWEEDPSGLAAPRWYATNQVLPDGSAIVVGGRSQYSYEFVPKRSSGGSAVDFPLLRETRDAEYNNLYPFVFLNVDGNLFIFANNKSILLDYKTNTVVRTYPAVPDGHPRNYPSTGSAVLLPLQPSGSDAEVLVCGGAPAGTYTNALKKVFGGALATCLRMSLNDPSPSWSVETMPTPRVMGDMILLPSGEEVLIINGAAAGSSGWELGRSPVLTPVGYRHSDPAASGRFDVKSPTTVPRMYHSSAVLLRDGRVLVGGSNPHAFYNFTGVDYPTDLSLEAYSPEYLAEENSRLRPEIVSREAAPPLELSYGEPFSLQFTVAARSEKGVSVTMVAPAFATHSLSMNQRLLILQTVGVTADEEAPVLYEVEAVAPRSAFMAPPGYYMVFVVNGGIPSEGIWVHI